MNIYNVTSLCSEILPYILLKLYKCRCAQPSQLYRVMPLLTEPYCVYIIMSVHGTSLLNKFLAHLYVIAICDLHDYVVHMRKTHYLCLFFMHFKVMPLNISMCCMSVYSVTSLLSELLLQLFPLFLTWLRFLLQSSMCIRHILWQSWTFFFNYFF